MLNLYEAYTGIREKKNYFCQISTRTFLTNEMYQKSVLDTSFFVVEKLTWHMLYIIEWDGFDKYVVSLKRIYHPKRQFSYPQV